MNNYKLNKAYRKYYLKKVERHFVTKWDSYPRILLFIGVIGFVGDRLNIWFFKPSKLYTLLDRFFYDYAKEHPEVLTRTKAFKWPYMTNEMEGKLNDVSTFQVEYDSLYVQKEYEFLDRYNLKEMTARERLSANTFRYIIEQEILAKLLFKNTKYPIDHVDGLQVQLPLFMKNCHTIQSISDAKNYISRLIDMQDKIAELIAGNRLNPQGQYKSITTKNILYRRGGESLEEAIHHFHINEELTIPPKSVLRKVKEQLEIFLNVPIEENVFYVDFLNKIDNVEDDEIKNNYRNFRYQIRRAVEDVVIPSFDALYRTVSELEMQAPEEITSMQYDLGEMYYQHCLRNVLGMNDAHINFEYRPKNLYFLGKKLLSKETFKLHQLLDSANIEQGSLRERIYSFAHSRKKLSHNEYINTFRSTFLKVPTTYHSAYPIEFEHYPALMQKSSIEPFYYEGSFDNTRNATIFFSDSISIYDLLVLKTVAVGIKGVHQWSAFKVHNEQLPLFRRGLSIEFIKEFWKNIFIHNVIENASLEDRIGYQLWRIHNLVYMVCDLGIHHYLWTKKEALQYVYDKSVLNVSSSEKIVDLSSSSIGHFVARGFAMHIFDEVNLKQKNKVDIQEYNRRLESLFKEGSVTFSSFKELMFVNNGRN